MEAWRVRLPATWQRLFQDDDEDEVMLNFVVGQFDVGGDALPIVVHRDLDQKKHVTLIGRGSKETIGFLLTTLRIPLYLAPMSYDDGLECNVRYS